jgi:hypothetical protein
MIWREFIRATSDAPLHILSGVLQTGDINELFPTGFPRLLAGESEIPHMRFAAGGMA